MFSRKQSVLPDELKRHVIADMVEGETAYTVSWAIRVAQDGAMWIRGDYSAESEDGGTACMKIRRRGQAIEVNRETISPDVRFVREDISDMLAQWKALPVVLV